MPQYKFTYFNGRYIGECARQLFALADQQYDDVRLTLEEFFAIKDKLPFGQLPLLEEDDRELTQSNAINRYLARKFGFAGETPFEEALVDSLADQFVDYRVEIKPYMYTAAGFQNFGDVETLKKEIMLPARDKFLGFITKFLKRSPSGFLVGESVTWIDLLIAEHVSYISAIVLEYFEGFPEVKTHMEKVQCIPNIKKWIESRPNTPY